MTAAGMPAHGGSPDHGDLDAFASAELWIVDLDGVIWLTGEAIGEVASAVADLRSHGVRIAFATNNSAPTTAELLARLDRLTIAATGADLVTSAEALASLLDPGQSVKVLAEGGVTEALEARGVHQPVDGPFDAAVVGWSHTFDFDLLAATATAARSSGRLLASNEDPTHPTPAGLMPGAGSILAAVATASGIAPEIAGKPHRPMAALMMAKFGFGEGDRAVVMVGDQPRTDGGLAHRLRIPYALVDSGVTPPGATAFDVPVSVRYPDFVSLVRASLAERVGRTGRRRP
jgi:HAD superfamily hydrolase (TIGR01450 family)